MEAVKLGVSDDIYNQTYRSIIDVNKFIVSTILTYEDQKLNGVRSVPVIKRSNESGGGITYPNYDEFGVPVPYPAINVYKSVSLSYMLETTLFSGPYKIKATVFVQAGLVGVWAYSLHDADFSGNISATWKGFESINTFNNVHEFRFPLIPYNGICPWQMVGRQSGADNTPISVTYTSNLK